MYGFYTRCMYPGLYSSMHRSGRIGFLYHCNNNCMKNRYITGNVR